VYPRQDAPLLDPTILRAAVYPERQHTITIQYERQWTTETHPGI